MTQNGKSPSIHSNYPRGSAQAVATTPSVDLCVCPCPFTFPRSFASLTELARALQYVKMCLSFLLPVSWRLLMTSEELAVVGFMAEEGGAFSA